MSIDKIPKLCNSLDNSTIFNIVSNFVCMIVLLILTLCKIIKSFEAFSDIVSFLFLNNNFEINKFKETSTKVLYRANYLSLKVLSQITYILCFMLFVVLYYVMIRALLIPEHFS